MPRVRPVLAAVLLVVASATAAVAVSGDATAPVEPADDPVVATSENSTRVLLLTEADAAAFEQPDASVTDTLQSGHAGLSTDFQLKRVRERLDAADDREAKRAILQNATDWAASRVDALRAREAQARAAYASGDISAAEYVTTLGTVHSEAASLSTTLGRLGVPETLYAYADANGFSDIGTEIYQLRAKLQTVQGPVRERVAGVVHGQRSQVRVQVTVGNGVMLSTIQDGQYVRETYRPGNVDAATGGTISDAPGVIQSKYPWLWNHSTSPSIQTRGGYAYYYASNYGHGQLTAYADTTTERVYVEHHQQTLAQLPTTVEASATANNTTLLASRTYTGGPLLVRVENETGAPVAASVSLDGTVVGETGSDGRIWLLSPAGQYTVSTETAEGTSLEVNMTARPAP